MAQPQKNRGGQLSAIEDRAPRQVIFEYEIPNDEEDRLWDERTATFGSLRSVGLRLLTPLQEKSAAQSGRGDMLVTAYEMAKRAIAEVTNDQGETIQVRVGDNADELWAQMHPKIRSMVIKAMSENQTPKESTETSFLASRKIKA